MLCCVVLEIFYFFLLFVPFRTKEAYTLPCAPQPCKTYARTLAMLHIITSATKGEGGDVFTPLCPCFFVCLQDISKSCGQVGCVTRMNGLDFGEDPGLDPTTRIFKVILHH